MVPCLMRSPPPRSTPHCKVTKARLRSQPAGRWPAPSSTKGETTPQTPGERGAAAPGPSTPGSRSSVAGIPVKCSRNRRQVRRNPQLANGVPGDDTIARIVSALSVSGFRSASRAGSTMWPRSVKGEIVAVDGKTHRRSHDRNKGVKALHMVSAWASGMVWSSDR